MIQVLKTVLIYLLMACLPLSVNAAALSSCDRMQADCHLTSHGGCDEAAQVGQTVDQDAGADQSHEQPGCGGCHACAAAAPSAQAFDSTEVRAGARSFHSPALAEFVPSGPKRPPR